MKNAETPLTMEERHVFEGERRIARQESLVAYLDRNGHVAAAELAQALLRSFRTQLGLARERVVYLQAKATGVAERASARSGAIADWFSPNRPTRVLYPLDRSGSFPVQLSALFQMEGASARDHNIPRDRCVYQEGTVERVQWLKGWDEEPPPHLTDRPR